MSPSTHRIAAALLLAELLAGARNVRTLLGGAGGATAEDIALMKRTVGGKAKIKASTGINCRADADNMIRAGAVRLGTSKGIRIVTGE